MKKTVRSSKLNPSNFVRRVFSRTSLSKTSVDTDEEKLMENSDKAKFESELEELRGQIASLRETVAAMHRDGEKKDRALSVLAKEKEHLSVDLKKQRRSNVNLKQQLEDERHFYYLEKEQYCHEMNSYKKMKQKSERHKNNREVSENECEKNNHKKEISELKNTLEQTLEANYNLSVKFLRMKNTKFSLKCQLSKLKNAHEKAMQEYRIKIEELQKQLDSVVQESMMKPIPPSNKKYLQIIKHNGILIHENLALQFEIDRLHLALEKVKMLEIRNDTNSRLKYIRSSNKLTEKTKSITRCEKEPDSSVGTKSVTKSNKSSKSTSVKKTCESDEREKETSSVTMIPSEKEYKRKKKRKELRLPPDDSKYELMNISNSEISTNQYNDSEATFYTSLKCCQAACRTQSAPEIIQNMENAT